ncbi:hypothetical protein [Spirosoma oryzicola]|uniref:Uncharacterized protein n=2 Tax=Spirosoma liriopis TaxID=2937440 RepID=A0ABT0HTR1_9BACT|nr:hypothetical protein [Spirosoma oryzicola]MCK8495534.1 hypothetical protein [Spirosoma liriopis]UHG94553.1 hypothetical protein LQ777_28610 [Spirosoma oryzicola]
MFLLRGTDVLLRAKTMQALANLSVVGSPVGPFQIVDTETGEVVDKYLYIPGNPKQYRFDAKEGKFSIHYDENNIEKLGSSLSFQPIAWRIFSDDILGQGLKIWAELFFIDEADCVSEILFHGYSVANLKRLITPLVYNRIKLNEVVLTVNADKRENNKIQPKGIYYIASFTYKPADKDITLEMTNYVQTINLYRRETLTETGKTQVAKNVFNPFVDMLPEPEPGEFQEGVNEQTILA